MIGSQTKPVHDRSKEITTNLLNKYDANSLATNTVRFSVVSYDNRANSLTANNNKIEMLNLVSKLRFEPSSLEGLRQGIEYVRLNIFGQCRPNSKCKSPTKAMILFTDRKLDSNAKNTLRGLAESGVHVIVVVVSDSLDESSFGLGGLDNLEIEVYPIDGGDGDGTIDLINIFEKGKNIFCGSDYVKYSQNYQYHSKIFMMYFIPSIIIIIIFVQNELILVILKTSSLRKPL